MPLFIIFKIVSILVLKLFLSDFALKKLLVFLNHALAKKRPFFLCQIQQKYGCTDCQKRCT